MGARQVLENALSDLERGSSLIDKTALMQELGLGGQRTALYSTFADLNARIDEHNRKVSGRDERAPGKETGLQEASRRLSSVRADRDFWKALSDGYAQTIMRYALANEELKSETAALRAELEALAGVARIPRR
ncbi:hypothetical protein ACNANV_11130 [Curtobacterium flaccumfaciens pv. flaccumfaciens]|uniref:hypothetical protein n=1 Tax=Curtobacterium flaccumfaciens TaxID=2035 RepID=UPI003A4E398C